MNMKRKKNEREREEREREGGGERGRREDRDREVRKVCRQQMDRRTGKQKDKSTENEFKKTDIM